MKVNKKHISLIVLATLSIIITIPSIFFIILTSVWPIDDELAMRMTSQDWMKSAVIHAMIGSFWGILVGLALYVMYWSLSKEVFKEPMNKVIILWFSLVPLATIIITSIVTGIIHYNVKPYM